MEADKYVDYINCPRMENIRRFQGRIQRQKTYAKIHNQILKYIHIT